MLEQPTSRLLFSKKNILGTSLGIVFTTALLYLIGDFFFNLISLYEGSDYSQNSSSIDDASLFYSRQNTPSNIFYYLILDAHFYFWLNILRNLSEDNFFILQCLTIAMTFILIFPTAKTAGKLSNKFFLFAILLVLFLHPRFIDLVAGNIRSATAIAFLFWGMTWKASRLRYLLLFAAPTFHLSVGVPLGLYFLSTNWYRLPRFFNVAEMKILSIFVITGILTMLAKTYFPDRGEGVWEGGAAYTIAIFIMALYVYFIGKQIVHNRFGFVALGLISMAVWGALLGYASMRYFNYFLPFFAASMLIFHRQPSILIFSFFGLTAFTLISHLTWLY